MFPCRSKVLDDIISRLYDEEEARRKGIAKLEAEKFRLFLKIKDLALNLNMVSTDSHLSVSLQFVSF